MKPFLRDKREALSLRLLASVTLALAIAASTGCFGSEIPGGQITVKNSIQDKEYNSITVSGSGGGRSIKVTLDPGQQATLPRGIKRLTFFRKYQDYSRVYNVVCPADFNQAVTMRLIDVHMNKMGGGCELLKQDRKENSNRINWNP